MLRWNQRHAWAAVSLLSVLTFCAAGTVSYADQASDDRVASYSALWQQSIDRVGHGDFAGAVESLRKVPSGIVLTDRVRGWLEEFEKQQKSRLEWNKADFEKYVRYSKQRLEREEFALAMDWALLANDVAEDQEEFIKAKWLHELVNQSLAYAGKQRAENEYRNAWRIYSDLATLFEREPMYRTLEREVQTHWRLDTMFEEGNNWEERLEKVRWEDARESLENIAHLYVQPADFKQICESGLEQVLMLAGSPSAQEAFKGLGNEEDRNDFLTRVQVRLDRVRAEPSIDWRACTEHFRLVVGKTNNHTVRLPESLLVSELMRGALEPLDDYTTIIWPSSAEEFSKHTRGNFIGVGISIIKNRTTDEIEVVSPLEGSPAYRAGVQPGDTITHVDGNSLSGFSLSRVVKTITGPKGTEVTLTIRRNDTTIEFPLRRELIKIVSVKGASRDSFDRWNHWLDEDNGIGYIRIANFQRNTPEDVDNVLSQLEAEGLRGLVLDLRGNPGGLLDSAWHIASRFLKKGEMVVYTRGRDRSDDQDFPTMGDGPYTDVPLVVLTDDGSASASEIVAGAIRDNGRGLVVGERTFGKFSVQNLIPLGRSKAKLKITTARYYLPSGVSLHREPNAQKWGVDPNIPVRVVRKEKINIYRMRRDAERLGPAPQKNEDKDQDKIADKDASKPDPDAKDQDAAVSTADAEDKQKQTAEGGDADGDGSDEAEVADAKPELPPLDQPDENDRPKEDPQLNTALLVMRIMLLGADYPTLANAETVPSSAVAVP